MPNLPHDLPLHVDRHAGAALIRRFFFPVSHHSLERWQVPSRRVNGKVIYETSALLAEAKRRFDAAPLIAGGRAA